MKESADNFYKRHGYTHKEVYKKIVYIKLPISASEQKQKSIFEIFIKKEKL